MEKKIKVFYGTEENAYEIEVSEFEGKTLDEVRQEVIEDIKSRLDEDDDFDEVVEQNDEQTSFTFWGELMEVWTITQNEEEEKSAIEELEDLRREQVAETLFGCSYEDLDEDEQAEVDENV